jgi:hypothetical protein
MLTLADTSWWGRHELRAERGSLPWGSFAKESTAPFFRISRSSLKILFSPLSLLSSSRSLVLRPSRSPRSICAC